MYMYNYIHVLDLSTKVLRSFFKMKPHKFSYLVTLSSMNNVGDDET